MISTTLRNGVLAFLAMATAHLACGQAFDGYALYNNFNSSTAYLIDDNETVAHTWACGVNANYSMALKPNGNLVRGAVHTGNQISGAAVGGKVQEFTPNATLVWEFVYSTADYVSHHDLTILPNGNVLLIAWVKKTLAELQAIGYTGTTAKYPGRIIEVQQNGTGGQVVWQWDMADRFIQYTNAAEPNYMPIAEHPERMNINVTTSGGGGGPGGSTDWFHENGVDYNAELDLIAFSSRYLSEVFIIDHSTTTAEAAGHTGGNSGRGGDFLFRWGKPANYGVSGTQRITAAVHDVGWVKPGRPYEGYLGFVNNSGGSGSSTTIDLINPDRVGVTYPWTPGTVWGPTNYDWRHQCLANASGQSAWDIMPNGNIFAAISGNYLYEVTSGGTVVWQYASGPPKAFRYTCDYPGIITLLNDPCDITTGLEDAEEDNTVIVHPNPSQGVINLRGIDVSDLEVFVVLDATGREVHRSRPGWTVDMSDLPDGVYQVVLVHASGDRQVQRVVLQR